MLSSYIYLCGANSLLISLVVYPQTFHMLIDPSTYGVVPGSVHFRNFIKEFFDEASMLVSLRHVNVIRVYGVSYDAAGIPWMLLELADMPLDTVRSVEIACLI